MIKAAVWRMFFYTFVLHYISDVVALMDSVNSVSRRSTAREIHFRKACIDLTDTQTNIDTIRRKASVCTVHANSSN